MRRAQPVGVGGLFLFVLPFGVGACVRTLAFAPAREDGGSPPEAVFEGGDGGPSPRPDGRTRDREVEKPSRDAVGEASPAGDLLVDEGPGAPDSAVDEGGPVDAGGDVVLADSASSVDDAAVPDGGGGDSRPLLLPDAGAPDVGQDVGPDVFVGCGDGICESGPQETSTADDLASFEFCATCSADCPAACGAMGCRGVDDCLLGCYAPGRSADSLLWLACAADCVKTGSSAAQTQFLNFYSACWLGSCREDCLAADSDYSSCTSCLCWGCDGGYSATCTGC